LRDHPHGRKNDAIHYVEGHFDGSVEQLRKGDSVISLSVGDAPTKCAMGRPRLADNVANNGLGRWLR
jgi:hypothetical protein